MVKVNGKIYELGLCKTHYVPDLQCNLISISKLTDNGCTVVMKGAKIVVY